MKLPEALIQSLQNVPGFDEYRFIAAHENPEQITSIRVNPAKTGQDGKVFSPTDIDLPLAEVFKNATPVPWCSKGWYLPERPSFTLDPFFHAGCYYVQEASSMFIEQAIKTALPDHYDKPYRVLDLCAAPGGKSTHLASLFPNGLVVSNEVIKTRTGILTENVIKWGTGNIVVANNDSADFTKLEGYFDLVLVDAPCSGSGMFRKDPDAITEWSPENVLHCSKRQQRILEDVWPCLKENGLLIYSTCSYSRLENEDITDWLSTQFGMESIEIPCRQEWNIIQSRSPVSGHFGYRFYPDKTAGEGFFLSSCYKREPAALSLPATRKKLQPASKADAAVLKQYLPAPGLQFLYLEDEILAIPQALEQELTELLATLYVKKAGIKVGKIIRQELLPDHELAASALKINGVHQAPVNPEQAVSYLKKMDINIDASFKGWCLITYGGYRLGWAKILPNRVNNYYPQRFRILKH